MIFASLVVALLVFRGDSFFWGQKDTETDDYDPALDPNDYGVDVSFPIHHYNQKRTSYSNPMKSYFMNRYEKHMKGCYDKFSFRECDANERARLEMSLEQPATQHNYTKFGFMKRRLPEELFRMITTFWEANKGKEKLEQWPRGNTYTNNWVAPTYMVNLEDKELSNGWLLKTKIWEGVRPIIEEWTGQKLTETSLYGIRVYKNNSVLATHVDRLPLVSSCIIQVAQDIDEPWPVEVIGHDGKAHNVSMLPGDMVLYESHSVLHGRPFPLKGKFYANIFVHYVPVDHEENNKRAADQGAVPKIESANEVVAPKIVSANEIIPRIPPARVSGHEGENHDVDTLDRHRSNHDADNHGQLRGQVPKLEEPPNEAEAVEPLDGQTALHIAAQSGDFDEARRLLDGASPTLLHARDANNWQPIHEAARAGHLDILKFLVELGADVTARTINGGSPLFWAQQGGENSQAAVEYLESIGAPLYIEDNAEK